MARHTSLLTRTLTSAVSTALPPPHAAPSAGQDCPQSHPVRGVRCPPSQRIQPPLQQVTGNLSSAFKSKRRFYLFRTLRLRLLCNCKQKILKFVSDIFQACVVKRQSYLGKNCINLEVKVVENNRMNCCTLITTNVQVSLYWMTFSPLTSSRSSQRMSGGLDRV